MNTLIYWGVVVAGAITLLIEAWRNYNQSLASVPFKEHPILQNVEIGKLSTSREKNIGFAFYSLLYLATYVIVLSSAEVFELLRQAARVTQEIGPTDSFVGLDQGPLVESSYGKPIFISAAIIAVFSLGALRPVETTMRSLAHRLAGIPRGVYAVIDALHSISYKDYYELECPKTLALMFNKNALSSFKKSFDVEQIDTILTALLTIDYLSPAITGKQRIQHFPFTQLEAMSDLSDKLDEEVSALRGLLSDTAPDEKKRAVIYSTAMGTANDSIALFAVHFLRNNRAIKNFRKKTAIAKIYGEIKGSYHIELNSFGMSVLFSLVCALLIGYVLVFQWSAYEAPLSNENLKPRVAEILDNNDIFSEVTTRNECLEFPSSADLSEKHPECKRIWAQVIETAWNERRKGILTFLLREVLPVWLAVTCAALAAILGREVRREDNSWPDWPLRRLPFMRLLSLSIIPAVIAVFCVSLGGVVAFWIDAGFHLTENQMTFFFISRGPFFLMHAILGIVVAIAVLVLADQHDDLIPEATLLLALFFSILALLSYYIMVVVGYAPETIRITPLDWPLFGGFEAREALLFGSCGFFFLIFFGIFLEITENRRADRRSLILSLFRRQKN